MNPKLEALYRQIPKSTCPPGCGRCCGILFPSLAELSNIREWCRRKGWVYQEFNYQLEVNCPYLAEDKSCAIYPVRPFLCRILGVSVDLRCEHCQPEALLNHNQSSWLYTQIYLRGKEKARSEKHRQEFNELLTRLGKAGALK